MRVKSIALWVLAVLLAGVLFYVFRSEMANEDARHVGLTAMSPRLSGAA